MSQGTSTSGQSNTPDDDTPNGGRIRTALGPFGMVPAGVIESGLSDAAVRLYAYLWRRTQNENHGRPSMATVGNDLGWSREKAKTTMRQLRESGLLTIVERFAQDGGQETNDYVLEWSSDVAPVVPYPEKTPRASRSATPPLFSEEAPQEETQEEAASGEQTPRVNADPGVTHDPGVNADPQPVPDPQGGHGRPPKKTTPPSPSTRGADSTTTPADGGTATPAARVAEAWTDAYAAAHTTPATAPMCAKATRTALELLDQGLAVEVITAAARAAGSEGVPWIDRYVARVTRVPGPAQAAPAAQWSISRRTYGAPQPDSTPTPTATRKSEACPTHPGHPADNCGGCRADARADEARPTRPYVDLRAERA
ncbi:hypothetical protein CLV30_12881 [Haloactinopolyspora alba]|uniref:Helix-turn-helix protein n=1 Tax=Haloactinopolyspora alba TaxID=648780 RepID=A0A2P8DF45_9ACTN|nr:hypothetical protein CLV30_12881 [Haloactinopolyspora alba]